MYFKLIVFDWDGTLMDSEARIVDCMQGAVNDVGLDPVSSQRVRDVIGLGLLEAVRTLFPEQEPHVHLQIRDRYRQRYLGAEGKPAPLFDGAEAVVRELLARDYMLAVATGKGRQGLDKAMKSTGMDHYFHATRCADETFSKPHPDMLLQIMDEMGALPGETLMVGDTEYDMLLAANAGTHALAVGYGVHERARLTRHAVLGCIDDVREMPHWLTAMESRPSPDKSQEDIVPAIGLV